MRKVGKRAGADKGRRVVVLYDRRKQSFGIGLIRPVGVKRFGIGLEALAVWAEPSFYGCDRPLRRFVGVAIVARIRSAKFCRQVRSRYPKAVIVPTVDSTKNTCTGASLTNAIAFNAPSANRFGWTIGVGTEWAVADNLSVFGEWDYMNFGTHNLTFTDPNFGSSQTSVKQQINVLKLGVNYRFGNSLPQQYP